MCASKFHLCQIVVFSMFSVLFHFLLSNQFLFSLFFYSLIIHLFITIGIAYAMFEMVFLHEKQGSKLNISKGKLIS